MAQRGVEGVSHQTVAHGVQAGQPRLAHTFAADRESSFMKAGYGKTVRPVCAADGGQLFIGRLLRPDSCEADEQGRATGRGVGGAKGGDQEERGTAKHAPGQDRESVSKAVATLSWAGLSPAGSHQLPGAVGSQFEYGASRIARRFTKIASRCATSVS